MPEPCPQHHPPLGGVHFVKHAPPPTSGGGKKRKRNKTPMVWSGKNWGNRTAAGLPPVTWQRCLLKSLGAARGERCGARDWHWENPQWSTAMQGWGQGVLRIQLGWGQIKWTLQQAKPHCCVSRSQESFTYVSRTTRGGGGQVTQFSLGLSVIAAPTPIKRGHHPDKKNRQNSTKMLQKIDKLWANARNFFNSKIFSAEMEKSAGGKFYHFYART